MGFGMPRRRPKVAQLDASVSGHEHLLPAEEPVKGWE
jgi:hypothetical protein